SFTAKPSAPSRMIKSKIARISPISPLLCRRVRSEVEYGFPAEAWRKPRRISSALQVAERIDRRPVDTHLEMEMRTEGMSCRPDIPDYLTLRDASTAHSNTRLMRVGRSHPAS